MTRCRIPTLLWIAVGVLTLAPALSDARERTWYKYENAYFEAYSDASEKKVLRLLSELENFRAAIAQVVSFEMPDTVAKTQVIIFRSKGDFQAITDQRGLAGFVVGMQGVPYIVMPVGGGGDWSKTTIRHEYTHVLLGYSGHNFPRWYNEGFSEFMSGTEFKDNGSTFTIGQTVGRQRADAPWVPWDELMAGDFEFHSVSYTAKISNGYLQSWLLVHYLTLGDDFRFNDDLSRYLGLYGAGISSEDALQQAFGMTPNEIGAMVLREYRRKSPYYVLDFKPGIQDLEFSRTVTEKSAVDSTSARIRDLFADAGN